MKKIQKINVWGAIASLVVVIFFFSCKPGDSPGDPDNPDEPIEMVKPEVKVCDAENVTANSAVLTAWVSPHEVVTKVSFEYKISTEANFHSMAVSGTYSDKDSVKVSLNLYDLTPNSQYFFRVKAINAKKDTTSAEVKFSTYLVKDFDGNVYHVIKIGDQMWLQENLKTTHYANGDPIEKYGSEKYWNNRFIGSYCYYDEKPENGIIYGALYNWYVATDPRGLIVGYHVPEAEECKTLQTYLGGSEKAGLTLMKVDIKYWSYLEQLTKVDIKYWSYLERLTNSSGFAAVGSGTFNDINSIFTFGGFNVVCTLVTVTKAPSLGEDLHIVYSIQPNSFYTFREEGDYKENYNSIRLIKN